MWWAIGLIGVLLVVYLRKLHFRVAVLEEVVKKLNERHWADHELLLTVTNIAGNLNAIDAFQRVGRPELADEVRGYEPPNTD
jgi:hypothetical protein